MIKIIYLLLCPAPAFSGQILKGWVMTRVLCCYFLVGMGWHSSVAHIHPQLVPRIFLAGQNPEVGSDSSCLTVNKAKPKAKFYLGNLDAKALDKPNPRYPDKARERGISGVVKVDIVVDLLSGKIRWAKVRGRHKLLRDAVRDVVCKVAFPPFHDINQHTLAAGFLTYKFGK